MHPRFPEWQQHPEPRVLTVAQEAAAADRDVAVAAGHTLYDAAYRLSEACDQTEDTYASADPATLADLTRRIEALTTEAFDAFGVPMWRRG